MVAGDYLLFIEDSGGSRWLDKPLQVDGDQTLTLDLQLVAVKGTASRGDDPFVGKLIFGGLYGTRTITFTTDEDGHFAGFLPKEGKWEVEISTKDLGCAPCDGTGGSLRIPPVEVHKGPSGKALLDIEIPDTKLAGRVVVEETTPDGETIRRLQPGATVVVVRTPDSPRTAGGRPRSGPTTASSSSRDWSRETSAWAPCSRIPPTSRTGPRSTSKRVILAKAPRAGAPREDSSPRRASPRPLAPLEGLR